MTNQKNLLREITQKQTELKHFVNSKGMTHEDTIRCSQKLDKLLNKWQRQLPLNIIIPVVFGAKTLCLGLLMAG